MSPGIINSVKYSYKAIFIQKCLQHCDSGNGIRDFQKKKNSTKDTLWSIVTHGIALKQSTVNNTWHNIWPALIFLDGE